MITVWQVMRAALLARSVLTRLGIQRVHPYLKRWSGARKSEDEGLCGKATDLASVVKAVEI